MPSEQTILNAVVVSGYQVASGTGIDSLYPAGTIAMQKPVFKDAGLDLAGFFNGTVNIQLPVQAFTIKQPDLLIENVAWAEGVNRETFSFVKCQIMFASEHYNGWVYYPHPETKTQHFQRKNIVEILAPKIPNMTYGDTLTIKFQKSAITLIR